MEPTVDPVCRLYNVLPHEESLIAHIKLATRMATVTRKVRTIHHGYNIKWPVYVFPLGTLFATDSTATAELAQELGLTSYLPADVQFALWLKALPDKLAAWLRGWFA